MEVFLKMIIIFLKVFCKPWDVFFSCPRNLVESSWKIVDSCIFSGFNLRVLSWTFTVDLWGVVSHIGWGTSGLGKPSFLTKVWVSLNPLNGVWELKMFESVEGEEVHLFFLILGTGWQQHPVLQVNNLEGVDYRLPNKSTGAGLAFLDVTNGPSGMSFNSKKFCFFCRKKQKQKLVGVRIRFRWFSCLLIYFHERKDLLSTPWKINMEPTNHPIVKENHLPNHHFQVPC